MNIDVCIIGGGGAGLWLLDELHRCGFSTLLLENTALGGAQTVASQGILHGGLKYAITGSQRASAAAIKDMPALWRDCINGDAEPDLRGTAVRADHCHMWRTTSLKSTLGMIGAQAGLRSSTEKIAQQDRPPALASCPGDVFRIDEQVIDAVSFIRVVAERHRERIILVEQVEFDVSSPGHVTAIRVGHSTCDKSLTLEPTHVVLTAGAGNAVLRERVGLSKESMQRRPLHMAMVRGPLPELFGHCIDGAHTRATITAATDSAGKTVWQVGGQVAEDGVNMGAGELVKHAHDELTKILPGVDFASTEWSTYAIDRAEGRTDKGRRPEGPVVHQEGDVITAWPTKLVLFPQLSATIRNSLDDAQCDPLDSNELGNWPRPEIAKPPWEMDQSWLTL